MAAIVKKYLPWMIEALDSIPDGPDGNSGSRLLKGMAKLITNRVQQRKSEEIAAWHHTNTVFEHGKEPSVKTIQKTWWENNSGEQQFLFRSLLSIGPADLLSPPYYQRASRGILCQPHPENNNLTPIEYIANQVNMIFCRASHAGNNMDEVEVMDGFVEIFTSTKPVDNPDIDQLSFFFVKGQELKPVRANRLDVVHALRLLFYTGYMVFFANKEAFKFCDPLILITNVFSVQTNFFPNNKDMDEPLSEANKNNYLLALGLNVYHAMRKDFHANFFLPSADLFPTTVNPTMMPAPNALNYTPGEPPPPTADHQDDIFMHSYFLFGNCVPEGTTEENITAEIFDSDILDSYDQAVNNDLTQMTGRDLLTLLTICCPKSALNLTAKKGDYGLKDKKTKLARLTEHLTAFADTHGKYINELRAASAATLAH